MIYQKFDTDISKISILSPTIRYDNRYRIDISTFFNIYIEAALKLAGRCSKPDVYMRRKQI